VLNLNFKPRFGGAFSGQPGMNSTELHLHHAQGRLSSITRAPCRKVMGALGQRSQAARKVKWVLVVVIQAEKRNAAELVGDMKGPPVLLDGPGSRALATLTE